jgi:hypothetical protein
MDPAGGLLKKQRNSEIKEKKMEGIVRGERRLKRRILCKLLKDKLVRVLSRLFGREK